MGRRNPSSTRTRFFAVFFLLLVSFVSWSSAFAFFPSKPLFSHLAESFFRTHPSFSSSSSTPDSQPPGGGIPCIACTVIVTILDQLSNIHNQTVEKVLDDFCSLFPSEVKTTCDYYVNLYGEAILDRLEKGDDPDEACLQIKICNNPECRLNAPIKPPWGVREIPGKSSLRRRSVSPNEDPWQWLKNIINRFANNHEPVEDLDGDFFSDIPDFRGSNWRGADCDDLAKSVHPGRAYDPSYDPTVDTNCNGISGSDENGVSYEKTFCENSGPLGVIAVGDSATAHFHIPPAWFNASMMNDTTFSDLLAVAAMEVDWPHMSGYTGWVNSSMVDSIYLRLRERNLCNHRDFQNAGVNGARAGAVAPVGIVNSVARDQQLDNPAILFLSLIGNDVCDGHPDFESHMTTPQSFAQSTLETLQYLDTILPNGSHVVFIGLANGSLLWDVLNFRLHPIGVTYADLYSYLICMQETPCYVWMNPNATVRELGTARAMELSMVYPEIIANYTFNNFDMEYYDFPLPAIGELWESMGGELWQLIEPCDGFHPNQIANKLFAQVVWGFLETDHPDWLGNENPYNPQIQALFGDQGGYTS